MARLELQRGERGEFSTGQKADGRWRARCYYRDEQGRRRELTATATSKARSLTLAKKKWSQVLADLNEGKPSRSAHRTTLEEMLNQWHAEQDDNADKPGKQSAATVMRYRQQISSVVLPLAGGWLIDEITPGRLNRLFDSMIDQDGNGLSNARNSRSMLSVAFKWAVGHEMLTMNPVRDTNTIAKRCKAPDSLSDAEIEQVRRAIHSWSCPSAQSPRLGPRSPVIGQVLELLLGTGARIGEILALRWDNVHLSRSGEKRSWVQISETLSTVGTSGLQKTVPTKGGDQRMITIPEFVADILRSKQSSAAGASLVFTSRMGTPIPPNNVRRAIRRALRHAGLDEDLCRRSTPHAMRRTVATMVERELGLVEASKRLGHSDEKITREHYVTPVRKLVDHASVLDRPAPRAES